MSMTIFLSDCLCFFVRFWKISQFSSWSSLKPTARWWFSSTDSSLYMRASSESERKKNNKHERDIQSRCSAYHDGYGCFRDAYPCPLTCVDEELVGNTWMVHIMDGCCKNGSQNLQIGKDSLWIKMKQSLKLIYRNYMILKPLEYKVSAYI